VLKTENVDNAKRFATRADAIELAWKCSNKCKGFQPVDLKPKRKRYATDVRRMIYLRNGGGCAICGKRLDLDNCNLDHRIPLSKGGRDNVENLDCVHIQCNYIKANLLVRVLLQHSSIAVTQRYIGIQSEEIEEALQNHIHLYRKKILVRCKISQ